MENIDISPFNLIGIQIRTNTNGISQLTLDMQGLWSKFISENISEKISDKVDNTIYAVYTDYEGDFTKPYTAFIGCRVTKLDSIPHGLIARSFKGGVYKKVIAKGNLLDGIIYDKWIYIISLNLDRKYDADFEVYGEKAKNFLDAEVEVLIGVN